jgi:hypothetical protein
MAHPQEIIAYIGAVKLGHSERVGAVHHLTDWHGKIIGEAEITAAWSTPRSYVSSRMFQVRATVDGASYTGRTAGETMAYRGKLRA